MVGEILQPATAASGPGRAVPGRPVLCDPERTRGGDEKGAGSKPPGTGVTGQTEGAVLHGRPDGGPVGGDPRGKGQGADDGGRVGR